MNSYLKQIFLTGAALLALATSGPAQSDRRAEQLIRQTLSDYRKADCVRIRFSGDQTGSLLLQGKCFVLDCAGITSWYDGETQWSYVRQNDEVNVSTPTEEELNTVHPYAWISHSENAFHCRYAGQRQAGGKTVEEVVLTPKQGNSLPSITLRIGTDHRPVSICLQADGQRQEFTVTTYETLQRQPLSAFRFPIKEYPNAEIVDLR